MSSFAPHHGELARGRLGAASVFFLIVSAAAPLTVLASAATTGFAATGIIGIPLAFAIAALVWALFSVGYAAMSRWVGNAGGLYSSVARGAGRPLGVGAGWVALLAYAGLQVGLYGAIGAAAVPQLQRWFDVKVEWWVAALVAWAIVAILGVLGVGVSIKVLALLLMTEIAIVLVYDATFLAEPAGGSLSFAAFVPENLFVVGVGESLFVTSVGAVMVFAVLAFIGFEASVVFAEESRDSGRTTALATYLAVVTVAGLYVLSTWAVTVAAGPGQIVALAETNGREAIFVLATQTLNTTAGDIGRVLVVTSMLAALIAFHTIFARYAFALGRDRALPGFLSATARRSGAPVAGSIVQSLIALVVIVIYGWFELDPMRQLFLQVGFAGGLGVLLLLVLSSLAVIAFFASTANNENAWRRVVAPTLAALALGVVIYCAVVNLPELLGVAADDPLRWMIPGVYGAVAVLGILWAFVLRATDPAAYAALGLGGHNGAEPTRVLPAQYTGEYGAPAGHYYSR
jgi:amino acid transporter